MKPYRPLDTAEAEKVLALQVTPVTVTIYFHRNIVFPFPQERCNIKLRRSLAVFTVSDLFAVDPDKKSGTDPVKTEKDLLAIPS